MVDLDQTLIHTTEQHCQRMSNKVTHLHVTPRDLMSVSFATWLLVSPCAAALRVCSGFRCVEAQSENTLQLNHFYS